MRQTYAPPPGSIPTLPVPSLDAVRSVHLIGIGGAGMRNLARLFIARGVSVTGSDLKDSEGLRELRGLGAIVSVGHAARQVGVPDAVVVSSAISAANVELAHARELELPVWARAQALAAFAAGHRSIAIAGTHGKTTTTSMLAVILERAGLDPSYLIGGDLNESGSGARAGSGDLFVFETDESDGSFLLSEPMVAIVTNIEVDHVDFYPGGQEEIESAFAVFMQRAAAIIACGDDAGVRRSSGLAGKPARTYGVGSHNDIRLEVQSEGPDAAVGIVRLEDGSTVTVRLRVPGVHNLLDATAALVAAVAVGVEPSIAARALAGFTGVHRRFELRGSARGASFFDDYGHNPTEMAVAVRTARGRAPERLIAVVQPHRYSRVQALWKELGASVTDADLILVTDVYGADQPPIPGVTGQLVADGAHIAAPDKEILYLPHRDDLLDYLEREVRSGDLVLTMGCGDVWMLADAALVRIAEHDA
ncbi:MAG: UDP-N-acetylmuramate--alanine ligase [Actinomycetota bacterium]|nr:UDP-N-acetylmuramate--alanine ligase [Actinomycetota bacterium]